MEGGEKGQALAKTQRKISSRNRCIAQPRDRKRRPKAPGHAYPVRDVPEARMDECERYLRCYKKPPDTLFDDWRHGCIARGIDPEEWLHKLTQPLKQRLRYLIGERPKPKEFDENFRPPKDRDLYQFYCWEVFDDPSQNPLAAELVTYLEDRQDDRRRHQASRSTWRVAEWKRAEAVVDALAAVIREFRLYYRELTGDEPEGDSRIDAVWPLLREAAERLEGLRPTLASPPEEEPEGRPMVGPEKNWSDRVQSEVLQRLERIRPWEKYEDSWPERDHAKMLRDLSEKIVKRLGIRGSRGIGSSRLHRPRPPSNPGHDIARRICHALGVKRLSSTRRGS